MTTARPIWWTALHDRALEQLAADWRPLGELKRIVSPVAFEDLVVARLANVKREPLFSSPGVSAGERTFFRLAAMAVDQADGAAA